MTGIVATGASATTVEHDDVTYVAVESPSAPRSVAQLAAAVRERGGTVVRALPVAGAVVVRLPRGTAAPSGVELLPDSPLKVTAAGTDTPGPTNTFRSTIGVPSGVDGQGVTVALLDTGVADVPDLAGRVTHVPSPDGETGDGYGHGTFLAGLIAGSGAASNGAYQGAAPGAKVLDVKVAAADGSTSLSRVLVGVQAVADRRAKDPSLRVLNVSLSSGTSLPPALDPLARALDMLWRQGVTVVVAAGNDGPSAGTVSSPGDDPTLLTVGSLDEQSTSARSDDTVSDFSSRGPTISGVSKPDLVAPGAHLVSLRAPGGVVDTEYPSARVGNDYFRGSGSSMAAAVVSGAVADLLAVRPALRPDDVKAVLTSTSYGSPGLTDRQAAGTGGLDLRAALTAAVPRGETGGPAAGPVPGGPAESDARPWAQFADAWQRGSYAEVAKAWAALSPDSRSWAARAWASVAWADAALSGDANLLARAWAARAWAGDDWLARAWAARAWASTDWAARAWAARAWAARAWAADAWTARAWAARAWASDAWTASAWLGEAWGR